MLSKGLLRFSPLLLLICITQISWAHPMGNFSVNHYSKITLERDRIQLRYFIDLAEIPTYQELQKANLSPVAIDPNSATVIRYIVDRGVELGKGLHLEIAGINAPLQLVSSGVIFPAGAGGLPTMKMGFVYEASYPAMLTTRESEQLNLYYSDNNFPGQSGWKEMVALSSFGSITKSSVPTTDRSGELSNYPTDLLTSPPQTLEVSLTATLPLLPVDSASAAATRIPTSSAETKILKSHNNFSVASATPSHATIQQVLSTAPASQNATALTADMNLQANRQQTPRSRFTDLIQSKDLSLWFLFTAALIAMGLGGLHALEPGHGKTIVAAYLVGSKGTLRNAALLGLLVTLSHTAGVFALGAITRGLVLFPASSLQDSAAIC
jgi:nickel/cobalt exporter